MKEDFSPWLPKGELGALGYRTNQIYPLDSPYGWRDARAPRSPLTYYQIKARPDDPLSPFIWGHYALMMVMGYDYSRKREATQFLDGRAPWKNYKIREEGYEGLTLHPEPDAGYSDASTTNKLLAGMLAHGFTWDEATATLERFPAAGGAYWRWMHQFPDEEKTQGIVTAWRESKKWRHIDQHTGEAVEETIPDHEPMMITSEMNPWEMIYGWMDDKDFLPNRYPTGVSIREKVSTPSYTSPKDGFTTEIRQEVVDKLLNLISSPPPSYSAGPEDAPFRVATYPYLETQGPSMRKSHLRDGYIPYMLEQGLIIEHEGVRGGKGRPPKAGFTLPNPTPTPVTATPTPSPSGLTFAQLLGIDPVEEVEEVEMIPELAELLGL